MSDEHGYAYASGVQFDFGVKNFLCFDGHFPFFFCDASFEEDVDMGNDVEGDFFGEFLRLDGLVDVDSACLVEEFVHSFFACPGYGLVSGSDDAGDGGDFVDDVEDDDGLDGGAIGVGDNFAVFVLEGLTEGMGIDFRHDEGGVIIHTEV